MAKPHVLLFDLGGVLVEAVGLLDLPSLLPAAIPQRELRRRWMQSPAVLNFECGRCSEEEFAETFIAEWGLGLTHKAFLARFRSWVKGPYAETGQLLSALRENHVLACLSNTNAAHWQQVHGMEALRPVLERAFLSYRIGCMKPDPAIYGHAIQELGCDPGDIAFFDDGQENVDAARRAGLVAHLTVGPQDLRRVLEDLRLL